MCNYQEDHSRRNNLQIIAIQENQDETWEQAATEVAKLLEDKLELPDMQLERAHRMGQRFQNRNRPIIARFTRYCDREAVMRNVYKLKGTKIFINKDLCPSSQNIKRAQIPSSKKQGPKAK
uniref:Uncharacterized protein n=1 Tax=Scylla olivacea TaxID=85551 RepID=A0A0P4WMU7_SCYOL